LFPSSPENRKVGERKMSAEAVAELKEGTYLLPGDERNCREAGTRHGGKIDRVVEQSGHFFFPQLLPHAHDVEERENLLGDRQGGGESVGGSDKRSHDAECDPRHPTALRGDRRGKSSA
jgi:hypothetical protein